MTAFPRFAGPEALLRCRPFQIGAPHNPKSGVSVLETLARTLPHAINLRMLIVDEVHHLLAGGYRTAGGDDLIKYLANDLQRSVVIVGASDAVLALQTDAQMSTRFTPMELPHWSESEDVSAWQFLRIGALVMPLALVAAFGAMLLQN